MKNIHDQNKINKECLFKPRLTESKDWGTQREICESTFHKRKLLSKIGAGGGEDTRKK